MLILENKYILAKRKFKINFEITYNRSFLFVK